MAEKTPISPAWSAFGESLIAKRRETPRTTTASASFVDRMSSSAAESEARAEGEAAEPPAGAPSPADKG